MASRVQLQESLQKKYNRLLFAKEVLSPIFNSGFTLFANAVDVSEKPNKSESKVIQKVQVYGKITLDDYTEINCYEILLQPNVLIERSRVAIQHYVRKILTTGQAALINFVSPTYDKVWRLTFISKDSILTEKGVKEKVTHARRYTYLLGPSETCRTAAERFESISTEKENSLDVLIKAFSVERLSKIFFDEYKRHYDRFIEHLSDKAYKIPFFKNDDKAIRDFTKKLLGRIVFLYFVQKKGWLGASDTNYSDGDTNFMMNLFLSSGANDTFYPNWLTKLFFDTLNTKVRNDDFELPNGNKVKIPYLNGGLFDKEEHDDHVLVFNARLFHNTDNPDDPNERGFLDFLNSFNFTVFEDSPEEHTVAVDPEMLGHIFENLLEDNKDKGAFYTPKEIVHYMCQETLTEYLATQLAKEYKVYRKIGDNQFELFGNETRTGQLSMIEEIGDKAIDREFVEHIVQDKNINGLSIEQLKRIDSLLDSVKICDPAIGSGAFPMGLLLEIFTIKEAIAYQLDLIWKPAEVKENIIQNSIYGVDIEKGAVDIARLRFWLSLVVDETIPKPLPNLDYKIVVGNSLISKFEDEIIEVDWGLANNPALQQSRPDLFKKFNATTRLIIDKQKKYFSAEGNDKRKITKDIRLAKIDLLEILFEVERQKLLEKGIQPDLAKNKKETAIITERKLKCQHLQTVIKDLVSLKENLSQPFKHFDWKLDFPEILNPFIAGRDAGFDIVIGNPPYVSANNMSILERNIFNKLPYYQTLKGKWDLYIAFIEKALKLLSKESVFTFIVPYGLLNQPFAEEIRKYILINYSLLSIVDLHDKKIFENATVPSCIPIVKNAKLSNYRVDILNFIDGSFETCHKIDIEKYHSTQQYMFRTEDLNHKSKLLEKIKQTGIPLETDFYVSTGAEIHGKESRAADGTTISGKSKFDVLHKQFIKGFKPYIEGAAIPKAKRGRYSYPKIDTWLDYSEPQKMRSAKFTELFESEKIIIRRSSGLLRILAIHDISKIYTSEKCILIINKKHLPGSSKEKKSQSIFDIKYLLAIINSKLIDFYYESCFGGFIDVYPNNLKILPIAVPSKETEIGIIEIVDQILSLKKNGKDTTDIEKQIDVIVFKLYELTYEEVLVVEPYFGLSKEEYEMFELK